MVEDRGARSVCHDLALVVGNEGGGFGVGEKR